MISRRLFLGLLATPAIVRASSLMPVRQMLVVPAVPRLSRLDGFVADQMLKLAQPSILLRDVLDRGTIITFRRPTVFIAEDI